MHTFLREKKENIINLNWSKMEIAAKNLKWGLGRKNLKKLSFFIRVKSRDKTERFAEKNCVKSY